MTTAEMLKWCAANNVELKVSDDRCFDNCYLLTLRRGMHHFSSLIPVEDIINSSLPDYLIEIRLDQMLSSLDKLIRMKETNNDQT